MTGHIGKRLDRLATTWRAKGCQTTGASCAAAWHVRSDAEDPANPAPPGACPRCGRPQLVRTIVVVGADAGRI